MKITLENQTVHFLAERAAFWEEKEALIIADIHLGKATVFQKAGIPISEKAMEEDLYALTVLIHKMQAKRCIIVGDLIHAKNGLTVAVRKLFAEWIERNHCQIDLILGNHDKALIKNMPQEWLLNCYSELIEPPFCFSHIPALHPEYFVFSGHIHPKIALGGRFDRLVLRCFQLYPKLAILPAFSFFVGGSFIKREKNCKIFALAGTDVIEV